MSTRRAMREATRLRSRRIRAVLAGGLVFGVGAAATLAAWNDSEYSAATFTAGTFDIVGSTDGSIFSDHATSPGAALSFTAPISAMTPGNTTYALFAVKTAPASVAGTLRLTAGATPGGTGLAAHLTYGARTISGTTCNATTYAAGTPVVADGSALTVSATGSQVVGAKGTGQITYCFAVTLAVGAPNSAQGQTGTQTWQVLGTSS